MLYENYNSYETISYLEVIWSCFIAFPRRIVILQFPYSNISISWSFYYIERGANNLQPTVVWFYSAVKSFVIIAADAYSMYKAVKNVRLLW